MLGTFKNANLTLLQQPTTMHFCVHVFFIDAFITNCTKLVKVVDIND